jgi:two-component system cell cycle response regulator DivK
MSFGSSSARTWLQRDGIALAAIVMDVTMPVLDGIEATRLIKATKATRHARVIAYTGTATFDHRVSQNLFVAVLAKPAPLDAVIATVQRFAAL